MSLVEDDSDFVRDAVTWRHHLHRCPELAYTEKQTAEFVAKRLEEFGLVVHRGLGGTGVVGTLCRGVQGRMIGIRADMDGLRIEEQSGVPYASAQPGIMHACGHDGHVAMALAAARVCAGLPDLNGTVHFIFQPAEEGGAGARRMIDDGLFDFFPCDAVYALHNWPASPIGTCVIQEGVMMAANAMLEIELTGRGCHAAMPHQGTDVVLAACQLVVALQSVVSRSTDPLDHAVVSATQIHAGDAHNVMPEKCHVRGTARWFSAGVGDRIEKRLHQLSQSIADAYDCKSKLSFSRRYPATVNDPEVARFARAIVARLSPRLTLVDERPSMGAEDFAFMLEKVPGCYIWLGSGASDSAPGLHSPYYDFNDELIPRGIELWVSLVLAHLGRSVECGGLNASS